MGVDQLMQRIEQCGKWPIAWDPEGPGEIIAGKVLEYTTGDSPYGRCHVVLMEVQARKLAGDPRPHPARVAVWLSKEVLLREFKQQRPQIGELIAIKYLGPPDDETAYHQYKLIVDRSTPFNLEPLGGEEPQTQTRARAPNPVGRSVARNAAPMRGIDDELGVSRKDLPSQRPLAGVSR